jgi:serine protease Do
MGTGVGTKRLVLSVGVLGILGVGFAGGVYYNQHAPLAQAQSAPKAPVQPALWTEQTNPALMKISTPGSFAELAKAASPAVVFISTKQKVSKGLSLPPGHPFNDFFGGPEGVQQGLGSGFLINQDGNILTNFHVIEGADEIRVTLENGDVFPAKLIGGDPKTDVALIKIEAPKDKTLPVLSLGDSDGVQVGDWVVAIGNPFGLDHTVTAGIVSAKGRAEVDPGKVKGAYHDFIQTDASINPGNSGGPLLNARGEVIGINTAINAAGQGIGFAIPIKMVKDILPQLAATGKVARSWMGVVIQPVTAELYKGLGLSRAEGALIAEVVPGGPADKGGIKAGDVVTSFAGREIKRSEDLRWAASTYGTEKSVEMKILRDGKPLTLNVTLQPFPSDEEVAKLSPSRSGGALGAKTSLGISVVAVDKDVASKTGATEGEGVLVVEVSKESPANGRLQPGDVILAIGERAQLSSGRLKSTADFEKALSAVPSGKSVLAYVLRDGQRSFVAFTK